MILDFINDPTRDESEGWYLMLALSVMLLLRLALFTQNFNVGLQTAIRLCGATQYLGYSKLLRLSNPNDGALGQLVTHCTGDQERISEAVIVTVLFFGKCFSNCSGLIFYRLIRYSNHVRTVYCVFVDARRSYGSFGTVDRPPSLSHYGNFTDRHCYVEAISTFFRLGWSCRIDCTLPKSRRCFY